MKKTVKKAVKKAVLGAVGEVLGPRPCLAIVSFWQGIVEIVLRVAVVVSVSCTPPPPVPWSHVSPLVPCALLGPLVPSLGPLCPPWSPVLPLVPCVPLGPLCPPWSPVSPLVPLACSPKCQNDNHIMSYYGGVRFLVLFAGHWVESVQLN